jgi:ABC-2 type transport system ATP-binding protein
VEQIADHVIIINRGKMVRSGRLQDLLATGAQVEILADRVPPELTQSTLRGAIVEPTPAGMRVLVDTARKRETVEALWAAGCDVIAMTPQRNTLEDLFLKEVDQPGGAAR